MALLRKWQRTINIQILRFLLLAQRSFEGNTV